MSSIWRHGLVTAASVPIAETAGMRLWRMAILVPVHLESSIHSGLSARFDEVGAIGGAPIGAVGRPESNGHRGYSSLVLSTSLAEAMVPGLK